MKFEIHREKGRDLIQSYDNKTPTSTEKKTQCDNTKTPPNTSINYTTIADWKKNKVRNSKNTL